MIALGNTEITKAYLGSTEISKMYLGEELVFGGSSPTPISPYDAEVEYLESSGTQYINTGVYATSTLTLNIEFTLINGFTFGNGSFLFGTYSSGCYYSVALPSINNIRVPNGSAFTNISAPLNYSSSHIISYKPGSIYVDGVKRGTQSGTLTSVGVPIRLFGRNADTDNNKKTISNLKVHHVTISNNTDVIMELIPVRKDGIGYMYDTISKELFGNSGTGSFTYGNDVTS